MAKRSKKTRGRKTFIREWRKHRGLNQEALAERIAVSQETISRLERGQIAYTQPMLEALADALRCSPADLIMRDPTSPNSIWSIWDQIPATQRTQAFRILETFAKKTGTDD
jgi:transcriptional regulator with XRE-family HTH domain